ncbi:MAG: DNA alkylation repair protein [Gammaproteobacteria bacterium]|nr:DNA alkylation repair protein [Gammaproteobacteria bacterium]
MAALRRALRAAASPRTARFLQRYFRTRPGECGAGDRFLGVRVPALRRLARRAGALPAAATRQLLRSRWHEERLLALLLLVERYRQGTAARRAQLCRGYLAQLHCVNHWDLVDCSAPGILGLELLRRPIAPLVALARSARLWDRRIALLATLPRIRTGDHAATLRLVRLLLRDPEDLIHKAAGWMLREVGRRDGALLRGFLQRHKAVMPRTMLRYAIEHFGARERARLLASRR